MHKYFSDQLGFVPVELLTDCWSPGPRISRMLIEARLAWKADRKMLFPAAHGLAREAMIVDPDGSYRSYFEGAIHAITHSDDEEPILAAA